MLQIVVVVVVVVIVVVVIVMVVTVIDPIILNTVRATVDRSPVLLPRAGRGRAAGRLPLKDLADRESVLVHRVCGYVLHLGRLVKVDVAVGVVQVLLARVRHQRGRFPWIPARGWMEDRGGGLEAGDRHGRRWRQRQSGDQWDADRGPVQPVHGRVNDLVAQTVLDASRVIGDLGLSRGITR